MPEDVDITLELLANLIYLAQVEAEEPVKVRRYMMMAEGRLDQLMHQLRKDGNRGRTPGRLQ